MKWIASGEETILDLLLVIIVISLGEPLEEGSVSLRLIRRLTG